MKKVGAKTHVARPGVATQRQAAKKAPKPESEYREGRSELEQGETKLAPGRLTRIKSIGRVEETVFDGWLKVHRVTVQIDRGGVGGAESVQVYLLQRPGHDSTHVATLRLNGRGPPSIMYKEGDTRPSAALRGTPYVAVGIVAGSLDHEGVDAEATALMEIAEELGGIPIGKLIRLGDAMPTMPVTDGPNAIASSESDNYFLGVLSREQTEVTGDGGGLEVLGLMRPVEVSVADALAKTDTGAIRENARSRVALARGLDKVGFVPQLNAWIHDLPPALREKYDTLGLGATYDPRDVPPTPLPPEPPHAEPKPRTGPEARNPHLASKVSAVDLGEPVATKITGGATMLDGEISHLADDGTGAMVPVGVPVRIQTLHVENDRLKLAAYHVDPKLGPMVRLDTVERPAMVAKAALTGLPESLQRQDVVDLPVPLGDVTIAEGKVVGASELDAAAKALAVAQEHVGRGAKVRVLSAPSYASPGQSDLQYHFMAAEVDPRAGGDFVPLAEALRRTRSAGAGDANTEALLLRLADSVGWIPQLGMSVGQASGYRLQVSGP